MKTGGVKKCKDGNSNSGFCYDDGCTSLQDKLSSRDCESVQSCCKKKKDTAVYPCTSINGVDGRCYGSECKSGFTVLDSTDCDGHCCQSPEAIPVCISDAKVYGRCRTNCLADEKADGHGDICGSKSCCVPSKTCSDIYKHLGTCRKSCEGEKGEISADCGKLRCCRQTPCKDGDGHQGQCRNECEAGETFRDSGDTCQAANLKYCCIQPCLDDSTAEPCTDGFGYQGVCRSHCSMGETYNDEGDCDEGKCCLNECFALAT